ncbi:MAG: hypothetical protein NTV51_02450, partial [Verrucomicrobia bacterium]|nr:hypothetical protein [Verrucomicrobiota bacterium]
MNPYAGLTDPVDLIRVRHTRRKFDPLVTYAPPPNSVRDMYASLSPAQAERLIDLALDTTDINLCEDLARYLATLTDHDLSRLQSAWLESGEFWPAVIFRDSPAEIRDQIIHFLDTFDAANEDSRSVNHALCALAWIGDEPTQQAFARWERQPPPWRASLYVGPNGYAHTGGWELRDGRRRDLFHRECWAVNSAPPDTAADPGVRTFAPASGSCPWCSRPLVHMLELDLRDPRFAFVGLEVPVLAVLTCEVCAFFAENIFSR